MTGRIRFIKRLDAIIGPIAVQVVKLIFSPRQQVSWKAESILIIRPGGIGDAVLLIPAIQSMRNSFPNVRIDVLAERRNSEVFSFCSEIDNLFLYDRPAQMIRAIRGRYDIVIDTEQWYRLSAVIAYLTGAPVRVGFSTNSRGCLFSDRVNYCRDEYEMDGFLRLASRLSAADEAPSAPVRAPFISVHPAAGDYARALLAHLSGRDIIAIFPGGSTWEKRWGSERFHDLSCRLIKEGYSIVVVGAEADLSAGEAITDRLPESLNLCGRLSLSETSAVLNEASLLITGDSGIMHVACALGIKTVSLFGPGSEKKWAPPGDRHRVISKNLGCSPCTRFGQTPRCRKGRDCMKLITVDEVFHQAVDLLKE